MPPSYSQIEGLGDKAIAMAIKSAAAASRDEDKKAARYAQAARDLAIAKELLSR